MQLGPAIIVTASIAAGMFMILHGLANCIDWLALHLHRAATSLRELQQRRTHEMEEDWVRTLERSQGAPRYKGKNWD